MADFLTDFMWYRYDEVLGAWQPYVDVLKNSLERTCRKHGVAFREADGQAIYDAVPTWGPHPDVAAPLTRVGQRYPLVVLSNAADEQILRNVELLQAPFHRVYTAQQAQALNQVMSRSSLAKFARQPITRDIAAEDCVTSLRFLEREQARIEAAETARRARESNAQGSNAA